MKITASARLDLSTLRSLARFGFYGFIPPALHTVICVVLLPVGALLLTALYFLSNRTTPTLSYLITAWVIILTVNLVTLLILHVAPRSQYKSLSKMGDLTNRYIFEGGRLHIESDSAASSGSADVDISVFVKIGESSRFFYLYLPNSSCYIVDKLTVSGGTTDDLRKMLSVVPKQIKKLHL